MRFQWKNFLAIFNVSFLLIRFAEDYFLFIYAYELVLCLHIFSLTGPPRRVDTLGPPKVCYIKTEEFH